MAYFNKTVNPTPSDNIAAGYKINDFWRNTTSDYLYQMQNTDGNWVYVRNTYEVPNEVQIRQNPIV